jgi:Bacterial Ig-like domain
MMRTTARALVAGAVLGAVVTAQAPPRQATNLQAIRAYPGYFHLRPVMVVGTLQTLNDALYLESAGLSVPVLAMRGRVPDGVVEIRGEAWDIGRMRPDEPRLARLNALSRLRLNPDAGWPRPGEVVVLAADAIEPAQRPAAPSIRAIVLDPERYLEQTVTVTGQFSGRNLLGDLPDSPARSRGDFVLRSADAAIWVSGAEPEGRDFNLSLDRRRDTERWLRVTGTLRQGGGLQWIEAGSNQMAVATGPDAVDDGEDAVQVSVPTAPPPEVIFSAPTDGEIDVPVLTSVRVQFSRDIAPATFDGHVAVAYGRPGDTTIVPPPPAFTTAYRAANRVLEITFDHPLERFRPLVVTLDRGIMGTDGQELRPWSASFELGG